MMTILALDALGDAWATDGFTGPSIPAALEREAERLRRLPRPMAKDLLRLEALEDEIVARYLALTARSLTRRRGPHTTT